jgi:hypothetical protein
MGTRAKVLAAVVLVGLVGAGLAQALRKKGNEATVHVLAAQRMVAGEEIYRTDDVMEPFAYPPLFALPFTPLAPLSKTAYRTVWYFVNVGCVVLLAVMLARMRGRAAPWSVDWDARRRALFVALLLVLAGRHVWSVFANQTHDFIIVLLVLASIDAGGRGREALSGAWIGVAAACKATPLLFLPVFLWQRRWRASAALVLALAASTAVPDVLFPRNDGQSWTVAWVRFIRPAEQAGGAKEEGIFVEWNPLNQSLGGTLHRLMTPHDTDNVCLYAASPGVKRGVTLAAQLAVLAWLCWMTRRRRDEEESGLAFRRLGEGGAVACAMLLLSPMSSKSHFAILLLPFYFVLLAQFRSRDRITTILLAVCVVTGTLLTKGLLGRELGMWVLAAGPVTLCTLSAYAATASRLEASASR